MTVDKKTERMERRKRLLELRAEAVEKLNTDVRERVLFLLYIKVTHSGRYEYLENRYGISARRWQNLCNRAQLPGIDMISSILQDYPEYATWLMLGKASNSMQIDPTRKYPVNLTAKGWEEEVDKIEEALYLANINNAKNPSVPPLTTP